MLEYLMINVVNYNKNMGLLESPTYVVWKRLLDEGP